jgi:hypothetical protein
MDERSAILVAKEIEKHIEVLPVAKEHGATAIPWRALTSRGA